MDLFRSIISVIQTRKSFNYNKFFDYIISILTHPIRMMCMYTIVYVHVVSIVLQCDSLISTCVHIVIEILEEIMYLINQGTVKINILPIDTSTRYEVYCKGTTKISYVDVCTYYKCVYMYIVYYALGVYMYVILVKM